MTLLALFQPLPHRSLPATTLSLAWLLPLLAGRDHALPERLEDWQLRDLNLTRPFRGLGYRTHIDLP